MLTTRSIALPANMLVGEQVTLLPAALKSWRKVRQLSQRALADAAGCSEALVSTVESGHRQAALHNALAIARALEVPIEAIALVHIDLSGLTELPEAS